MSFHWIFREQTVGGTTLCRCLWFCTIPNWVLLSGSALKKILLLGNEATGRRQEIPPSQVLDASAMEELLKRVFSQETYGWHPVANARVDFYFVPATDCPSASLHWSLTLPILFRMQLRSLPGQLS